MPDVMPICWDPKRLSSSVYGLLFERSGISDGRINRQSARISLLLLCLGRVILGIGQSFAERDRPCGALAWLARCISGGYFVERHCHLRGDGDGCAVRRVFYHWGGLQALALIIMGVALWPFCWRSRVRR